MTGIPSLQFHRHYQVAFGYIGLVAIWLTAWNSMITIV